MSRPSEALERILTDAVEIPSPAARQSFLERECAGDASLLARAEELVANHFRAGAFLERPAGLVETAAFESPSAAGTRVGPYKLLEPLGEGGMGVVFVAEQEHPVRRLVALKVIKPGMDSKQVVARFEAERQALALMDHPNIAKVLDAGTTDDGRPYFVMELIRGLPITQFCDQARLTVRERLGVFARTCRAVQHAHTKAVIHRDLKPSNVLVSSHDGVPVPVVIDFGVAKALGGRLTDRTVYTGFHQMVGTPLYMSPEQVEFNQFGVDTRSDVYALGVLLYELLTGVTPIDRERLRAAGYDEFRRILREEEPPRPSARLSTVAGAPSTASARRCADAGTLTRSLHGDLDWIVLRALEKDRERRYQSASDFAADVDRYLAGDPVAAHPPSRWYRLRKLVRRHKVALGAGVAVAAALLAGTAVSVWQAVRATRAQEAEVEQRVRAEERTRLARDVIFGVFTKLAASWLQDEPDLIDEHRELLERAVTFSRQLLGERPTDPDARLEFALTLRQMAFLENGLGQYAEAERDAREAYELCDGARTAGLEPVRLHQALVLAGKQLANVFASRAKNKEVEQTARRAIADAALCMKLLGDADPARRARIQADSDICEGVLASALGGLGQSEEALQIRIRLVERNRLRVKENPTDAKAHGNLASALHNQASLVSQRTGQAEVRQKLWEESNRHAARAVELEPRRLQAWQNLATVQYTLGQHHFNQRQYALAEPLLRASAQGLERLADSYPRQVSYREGLASCYQVLAGALRETEGWAAAEPVYQKGVGVSEKVLADSPDSVKGRKGLAANLYDLGKGLGDNKQYAEAEKYLRRSADVYRELLSRAPTLETRSQATAPLDVLAKLLRVQGKYGEAAAAAKECLDSRKRLADEYPKNLSYQGDLGKAYHTLANAIRELEKPAEAIPLFRHAIGAQQVAFGGQPDNARYRRDLAIHHASLAGLLADPGDPSLSDPKEAIEHARKAIALGLESDPVVWHNLGLAQYLTGDATAAIQSFQKADSLSKKEDTSLACNRCYFQAMAHFRTGDEKQARAFFDRAETLRESLRKADPSATLPTRSRSAAAALLGISLPTPTGLKK